MSFIIIIIIWVNAHHFVTVFAFTVVLSNANIVKCDLCIIYLEICSCFQWKADIDLSFDFWFVYQSPCSDELCVCSVKASVASIDQRVCYCSDKVSGTCLFGEALQYSVVRLEDQSSCEEVPDWLILISCFHVTLGMIDDVLLMRMARAM